MSTRIFAGANYDLNAVLLPYGAFKPFYDREGGVSVSETYRAATICCVTVSLSLRATGF